MPISRSVPQIIDVAPPTPEVPSSSGKTNNNAPDLELRDIEPIDDRGNEFVVEALNLTENINNLPQEDQDKVSVVSEYIQSLMKSQGLKMDASTFRNTLDKTISQMGLDFDSDPSVVLDRISGVVSAWKDLSFVSNIADKQALFQKLAKQPDSSSMNKIVFQEMEKQKVWR